MNVRRAIGSRGTAFGAVIALSMIASCGGQENQTAQPSSRIDSDKASLASGTPARASKPADVQSDQEPDRTERSESAKRKSDKAGIDTTLRALADTWENIKGVSAKIRTTAKRDIADRAESRGEGIYNIQKSGDTIRLHYYVKSDINFWVDEQRYVTMEHVEFATDGKILEQITLQPEVRELKRSRFNPNDVLNIGGRRLVDDVRKNCKIKSMTSETRDGRDTVVFQCALEGGDLDITHAFDVQSGVRVEWMEKDKEGEVLLSVKLENLNTSPKFDEDDFALPPFGYYTLVDETGPKRKVLPWDEVVKTLSPEELARLTAAQEPKPEEPLEGPPPGNNKLPDKP